MDRDTDRKRRMRVEVHRRELAGDTGSRWMRGMKRKGMALPWVRLLAGES
jgi:hypothetical protein